MTETVKILKQIAKQQGITQVILAKRMGVTEVSVSRWFNDSRTPSIKNVEEMARALNCNLYVISGGHK